MKETIDAIARELMTRVEEKEQALADVTTDAAPIISLLKEGYAAVRELVAGYAFESPEEEIRFFKQTKPGLFFKLIYYSRIQDIEQHRPFCGTEAIRAYLEREQEKLNAFFVDNSAFIRYYRSGRTWLDEACFLRRNCDTERDAADFFRFGRMQAFRPTATIN